MKPWYKQPNQNSYRRPMDTSQSPPAPPRDAAVHRYVHPIRTARPAARPTTEELLSGMLETLERQSEQLDEVLRRLERDNSDTK